MAVIGQIRVATDITETVDVNVTTAAATTKDNLSWTIADGVLDDQADLVYSAERTLATGASEELDLSGVLADIYGNTIAFARVKALRINIVSGVARLLVGGAAANAWVAPFSDSTDEVIVEELLYMQNRKQGAYPVVAGTGDLLRIEHDASDAADVIYQIVIVGASA